MMRKFSWVLLVLLVLVECSDEPVLVESAADLKGVKAKKIIWEKDGAAMGSNDGDRDEKPVHTVELDKFYMDVYEVTVGQFREFVEDSGYDYDDWDRVAKCSPDDEYPMIHVDWHDATA